MLLAYKKNWFEADIGVTLHWEGQREILCEATHTVIFFFFLSVQGILPAVKSHLQLHLWVTHFKEWDHAFSVILIIEYLIRLQKIP